MGGGHGAGGTESKPGGGGWLRSASPHMGAARRAARGMAGRKAA